MERRPFPALTATAMAIAVSMAAPIAACGDSTPPPPPPVAVTIDGTHSQVPPGTTYGEVRDRFGLRARDGRLLSVSGLVLDDQADPGFVLLNGAFAPSTHVLRDGDVIRVVDGRDRTERTRRIRALLPQPTLSNPARTLTAHRMRQVTIEGRLSGETLSVREIPRGRGITPDAVALTFDDGPWPSDTGRILAILERFRVEATFFMIGRQAERYPELVGRVRRAGHAIGNHSYDHPEDPALTEMTEPRIAEELARTGQILADEGVQPTLFRPPGGSYDEFVIQEALRQRMRVVMWSVDPQDWRAGLTAKDIVKRVLKNVEAGSIILLHDGGGDGDHTVKALPDLIRGIKKKGLGFVAVPS